MLKKRSLGNWILIYLFVFFSIIMILAPPAWLFISSISSQQQLLEIPLKWIPTKATFNRYTSIIQATGNSSEAVFKRALLNSTIIALIVASASVFLGGLAAYAFTRLRLFAGRSILFTLLFAYMLPPIMIIVPLYRTFSKLGILDTISSLSLTYLASIMPFAIWTLRGYFLSLPKSLESAAMIDGCSRFGAFFRIVVPLSLPGIAASFLLCFILSWEEFLIALIFTSSPMSKTITVAIAEFQGRHAIDYPLMATGGMIAAIIPVLISLVCQKWLVTGLTAGSVKG